MRIKNNYHKKLSFEFENPYMTFSIGPGEEKEVSEELGRRLLDNYWIEEIKVKTPRKTRRKRSRSLSRQRSKNN